MNRCADDLDKFVDSIADSNESFNMLEWFKKLALDVIGMIE